MSVWNQLQKYKILILLCVSLFIIGCTGKSDLESATEKYAERLARVLKTDISLTQPSLILNYPNASERALTIPEKTLKLSEFYAINNCPLAPLIAQRNTALGKVESPSRRYIYELKLLDALAICSQQVTPDNHLIGKKLNDLIAYKKQILPMVRARLLQDSEAVRLGTGFTREFLSVEDKTKSHGFTETLYALQFLSQLETFKNLSNKDLEIHLEALEKYRLPAKMWRTQKYIINTLPQITQSLQRYSKTMSCSNDTEQQLQILRNILNLFFVDKIQAIGGRLNSYHYQFTPLLDQVRDSTYIAESVKAYWYKQTHTEFSQYQEVIKEHVSAWQILFKQCTID